MSVDSVIYTVKTIALSLSVFGNAAVLIPQLVWLMRDMKYMERFTALFDSCVAIVCMLKAADKDFWTYEEELSKDLNSLRYFKSARKRCALCRIFLDKWEYRIATGRCLNLKTEDED